MTGSVPLFNIDGPMLMPPPYGAIRSEHFFRGFKPLVRSLGGDYRKILEHLEIDPMAPDDPDYPIGCDKGAAMLEYCSRSLDDRMFGLRLAEVQDPDVYGCLSVYARTAPTLRDAFASMSEYLPVLHCPGANVETVATCQTAEFRWHPYGGIGMDEQSISHGLLLFVKFIESIAGRDFRPRYVQAVADLSRLERQFMEDRFGCTVHANASATTIGFDVSYLDRPLKTTNRVLRGLPQSYFARLKEANKRTLVEEVRTFIDFELSSGRCSLECCAKRLNVAARTLHRQLIQQGVRFSDIVEEQKCEAAKHMLLETDHSLDEIAAMVGYSEQSGFGRAFKRWVGMTPQAYREHGKELSPVRSLHAARGELS